MAVSAISQRAHYMKWLNYQHLYYFWNVAKLGTVTEAAQHLRLAQPTLSAQIRILEQQVEAKLFERDGRRLLLTSAGRIAFSYAEQIFALGGDLVEQLEEGHYRFTDTLRVGVSDIIPKMLAYKILDPLYSLTNPPKIICLENTAANLLTALSVRELDVVISDFPLPTNAKVKLFSHLLGSSSITFLGTRKLARKLAIGEPQDLAGAPLLLPSALSALRKEIDIWFSSLEIAGRVVGEFQDSALMKIFGKEGRGLFPVPSAIAKEVCSELNVVPVIEAPIQQKYYLIASQKRLTNPLLTQLYDVAREGLFLGPPKSKMSGKEREK